MSEFNFAENVLTQWKDLYTASLPESQASDRQLREYWMKKI